jgi:hypothetical protein
MIFARFAGISSEVKATLAFTLYRNYRPLCGHLIRSLNAVFAFKHYISTIHHFWIFPATSCYYRKAFITRLFANIALYTDLVCQNLEKISLLKLSGCATFN